jgi:RNase P subunit RPR2
MSEEKQYLFCEKCNADMPHYLVSVALWENGNPDNPPTFVFMCAGCGKIRRVKSGNDIH